MRLKDSEITVATKEVSALQVRIMQQQTTNDSINQKVGEPC